MCTGEFWYAENIKTTLLGTKSILYVSSPLKRTESTAINVIIVDIPKKKLT